MSMDNHVPNFGPHFRETVRNPTFGVRNPTFGVRNTRKVKKVHFSHFYRRVLRGKKSPLIQTARSAKKCTFRTFRVFRIQIPHGKVHFSGVSDSDSARPPRAPPPAGVRNRPKSAKKVKISHFLIKDPTGDSRKSGF